MAWVAAHGQTMPINLMPLPAKLMFGQGSLPIDRNFSVAMTGANDPRVSAAVKRLFSQLSRQTGMSIPENVSGDPVKATLVIHCERQGESVQKLTEDESYHLAITPQQARLTAPNALGILRGIPTFLQLVKPGGGAFAAPSISIEDNPRYPWRGLLLDVSRHWMPMEVVRRTLDGMTAVKLNVFHWHLSDDQGFRIESRRFPNLHEMGSDGHYFTQDQVREVIAYARDRGIRVVPEFSVPAHSTAWFAGYPDLASAPGPYQIGRTWGLFVPAMDPVRESTYTFLDTFFGEMAALFPDAYFHIGGDEVNGKQWNASASIQAFKKQHGMGSNHVLQGYFNRRIQAILRKYGKHMEGWDEIVDPDLMKDIAIQSWRGAKSLAQAARLGYDGILSSGYYLDLMHPASRYYAVDPLDQESAGLTIEQQKHILGGEAAMWAEFATPENIDSRIWPRAAAIAERLWSPRNIKDTGDMYRRLEVVSEWLERHGLQHRSDYSTMLERLAGANPSEPVQTLADICEPVKDYTRARLKTYTQKTPLNRMVDTVRPESDTARHFSVMNHKDQRLWLTKWRDNDARLKPVIEQSALLREVAPVSANVSRLAQIGLRALDYIDSSQRAPETWVKEQRAFIDSIRSGQAELLISIVPAIERLLKDASQ